MNRMGVAERVFLCMATVSFFVLVVALLALTIAEDPVAQLQPKKQQPMMGVIAHTNPAR